MSKQCLNISQMQHLRKLGVDTSKASIALVYRNSYGDIVDWDVVNKDIHEEDVGQHNPYIRGKFGAFTLQDILDLLPSTIKVETTDEINEYWLEFGVSERDKSYWFVQYRSIEDSIYVIRENESLIDAAYETLCWCIENGYIKTNKEE